ncbi:MAG: hypothetical protein D6785_06760, partial [Planctomycetota bacterium]
ALFLLKSLFQEVKIFPPLCCGRPWISKGFLSHGRKKALKLLGRILPFLDQGYSLTAVDSSCLFALKDYTYYFGLPGSEKLSQRILTLPEIIRDFGACLSLDISKSEEILIWSHCHERSHQKDKALQESLQVLGFSNIRLLEGSCCGMAGTFGLEVKNSEISAILGKKCFGKIHPKKTLLVTGYSCWQQARNFNLHPVFFHEFVYNKIQKQNP